MDIAQALTLAKGLSVVLSAVLLVAVFDIWRRRAYPEVSYGGITLGTKRLRWLWFASIVGAFVSASQESPLALRTNHATEEPAVVAELSGPVRTTSLDVPFLFYSYYRTRLSQEGVMIEESIQEGFLLPWQVLTSLFAYLIMVVRWNPENRWAMRILHGRRGAKRLAREAVEGGASLD